MSSVKTPPEVEANCWSTLPFLIFGYAANATLVGLLALATPTEYMIWA